MRMHTHTYTHTFTDPEAASRVHDLTKALTGDASAVAATASELRTAMAGAVERQLPPSPAGVCVQVSVCVYIASCLPLLQVCVCVRARVFGLCVQASLCVYVWYQLPSSPAGVGVYSCVQASLFVC